MSNQLFFTDEPVTQLQESLPVMSQQPFFKLHTKVNTPGGPGLVQGRTYNLVGGVLTHRYLVSHKPGPGTGGIWELQEYLPEQVTAI